jgi:uncharacterized membrane protein
MRASTLFGTLVAIGGASVPFIILWFRHRALRDRVVAHRRTTEEEREHLRRRGRSSVVTFVGFWLISLGLIAAVSTLAVSPASEALVLALILAMVVGSIWRHLSTRCPVCGYRLGYQRALGVPARCERCGVSY